MSMLQLQLTSPEFRYIELRQKITGANYLPVWETELFVPCIQKTRLLL